MNKSAIFGLYGKTNSGKTTLLVEIIRHLKSRGFKIATVKISNKEIEIDHPGKDSWKYAKARSDLIVLSSLKETDIIIKERKNINEILKQIKNIGDFDVIFVEGANDTKTPKIRIGDIGIRENTIFTFKDDFEDLIKIIESEIKERKK